MLSTITQGIKDFLFPNNCVICRTFLNSSHQEQLCFACRGSIRENKPPSCACCSRHLDHFTPQGLCLSCKQNPKSFDRAWGACLFEDTIRQLLHSYKYNGKTALSKTFLRLLTNYINAYHVPLDQFHLVVPIPLHPVRLRERGFNQAEILSAELCRQFGLSHAPNLLARIKATDTQTLLDQKQRFTNLTGAFRINSSQSIADKSILLVDDLLTTGATASSAAAALKAGGAAHVGVITLAITT